MALYSRVTYAGTGAVFNASFSFPYLNTSDIYVYVDGVSVPYTFLNTATVTPVTNPVSGAVVQVRRDTQKITSPVDFTDGSVILERDLDLLATYNLYLAQEASDTGAASITLNTSNLFDAQDARVVNLANPVDAGDAVNKRTIDNLYPFVSTVAGSIGNVNIVGAAIVKVGVVADSITSVNTVALNNTNVSKVAAVDAKVTTVANNDANVTTVAGVSSAVSTVAGISGNVTTVATNNANVTAVANNSSNVTTVAGINAAVTTVAGINAAVSAVNSNKTNINAVQANATNINAVRANETNINTAVANLPALSGKVGQSSAIGSAYLPSGTTAQRDGTPLAGYLRFNKTIGKPEVYTGSVWGSVGGGATGGGSDEVFVENDQAVTADYTIPSGKNASSVGPIEVPSGVAITVSSGSRWVVL